MMRDDLAKKYDLRVPRYTSYPTAPHFSDAVDADVYTGWLGELDPALAVSLYFHIPFCNEMCWFCGCYTKIVKRYEPVSDYLTTLLAEIDLVADRLPARFTAQHLHWGGGSPTMLTGDDWLAITNKLRERFVVSEGAEVAVEMDPRTATEEYVKSLARAGVNRASIGVQDYDDKVQAAIHRIQPYEVTERVIGWLRGHGISDINMDVMYGLPHQTVAKVEDMVDRTVALAPRRIALFGYAHVPWMKSHQKMIDESALPGVEERWSQAEAARERLLSHGYVAVGLDHFARSEDPLAQALESGRLHRNFQGYTVDEAPVLLGFGASAIGSLPKGYVQNVAPLQSYAQAVADGRLPVHRGLLFTAEDRLRGDIIERIMCDLQVDLDAVCGRHDADAGAFAGALESLSSLVEDGIAQVDGRVVRVTEVGRPFTRLVAAAFDSYLGKGEARHSRAV